jgi:hypothetical protein
MANYRENPLEDDSSAPGARPSARNLIFVAESGHPGGQLERATRQRLVRSHVTQDYYRRQFHSEPDVKDLGRREPNSVTGLSEHVRVLELASNARSGQTRSHGQSRARRRHISIRPKPEPNLVLHGIPDRDIGLGQPDPFNSLPIQVNQQTQGLIHHCMLPYHMLWSLFAPILALTFI